MFSTCLNRWSLLRFACRQPDGEGGGWQPERDSNSDYFNHSVPGNYEFFFATYFLALLRFPSFPRPNCERITPASVAFPPPSRISSSERGSVGRAVGVGVLFKFPSRAGISSGIRSSKPDRNIWRFSHGQDLMQPRGQNVFSPVEFRYFYNSVSDRKK